MKIEGAPPMGSATVETAAVDVSEAQGHGPSTPVIEARGLSKVFEAQNSILTRVKQADVHAVVDVSLKVDPGCVLGLAGESGSGKSVTAEMLARLQDPTSGEIFFRGEDITKGSGSTLSNFRRKVGMVFQSPFDSLNPRWKIADVVSEPLRIHRVGDRAERRAAVMEMLERVGLRPADYYMDRYPHELSGGELQRAAVARALILGPDLVIADEPTTMLDVSVRAGILNLLRRMKDEEHLAMLFISHDLTTLSYLCDRVAIMYLGRVVEIGPANDVLSERLHPYTNALAAAVPLEDPDLIRPPVPIIGDLTPIAAGTKGCPFAARCPAKGAICEEEAPGLLEVREDHFVSCHLHDPTKVVQP
jgi:peptide/nickel transport system ATP-binding protein